MEPDALFKLVGQRFLVEGRREASGLQCPVRFSPRLSPVASVDAQLAGPYGLDAENGSPRHDRKAVPHDRRYGIGIDSGGLVQAAG